MDKILWDNFFLKASLHITGGPELCDLIPSKATLKELLEVRAETKQRMTGGGLELQKGKYIEMGKNRGK